MNTTSSIAMATIIITFLDESSEFSMLLNIQSGMTVTTYQSELSSSTEQQKWRSSPSAKIVVV